MRAPLLQLSAITKSFRTTRNQRCRLRNRGWHDRRLRRAEVVPSGDSPPAPPARVNTDAMKTAPAGSNPLSESVATAGMLITADNVDQFKQGLRSDIRARSRGCETAKAKALAPEEQVGTGFTVRHGRNRFCGAKPERE